MAILVTGGLGFIGSHFVCAAVEAGVEVVVIDDRSAGTSPALPESAQVVTGDIGDSSLVAELLDRTRAAAIVHFAGKIEVGESVRNPGLYFDVNLARALRLADCAVAAGVESFVFSSSAAVYGDPDQVPIPESAPTRPVNPYGASKLGFEHILHAYAEAHGLRWAALRYFNAAGAHPSGHLVEGHEPETHLIPLALDAGLGLRPPLTIFGNDYPTPDGTCVRDYVHVCDLIDGHMAALEELGRGHCLGPINLGTGRGYSVRQIIDAAALALGEPVPHHTGARRAGDSATLVADPGRAIDLLGWAPKRSALSIILDDALRSRRAALR